MFNLNSHRNMATAYLTSFLALMVIYRISIHGPLTYWESLGISHFAVDVAEVALAVITIVAIICVQLFGDDTPLNDTAV